MASESSSYPHFRFRDHNMSPAAGEATVQDSALIIIDAQRFYLPAPSEGAGFLNEGMQDGSFPVVDIIETNRVIADLVEKYRKGNGTIVWVNQVFDDESTVESIKDTPLDFIDSLRPAGDEHVVLKRQGSSFFKTDLEEFLNGKGIKKIVLTGYQPQFCVLTTAVYGHHLGYTVFVVRDGVSIHNSKSWDGKRDLKGEDMAEFACSIMHDNLAEVILAKDVRS